MDRTLVIKLDLRQSALFDDILLIADDYSSDADRRLANVVLDGLRGKPYPNLYKHTRDLLDKLGAELYQIIKQCTKDDPDFRLGQVERTPITNVLTLYVRIDI